MRPSITRALLVVTALLAAAVPASAASPNESTSQSTTVTSGAGTPSWRFTAAARTADAAWAWVQRDIERQTDRGFGTAPATVDAQRLRRLPDRYRAVIHRSDLRANRWGQVEPHLTFSTGSAATAVCLDLNYGDVTRGRCGQRPPTSAGLVDAYRVLIQTAQWYDQRRGVFGRTANDLGLIRSIARTDLPAGWSVSFADANDDGRVDGRTVMLHATHGQCGVVMLPKRGVDGEYGSAMVPCG